MKGFKILLAGLVFLFTANTVSAVVITNAFMTDVVPSNCDDSRTSRRYILFMKTIKPLVFLFRLFLMRLAIPIKQNGITKGCSI